MKYLTAALLVAFSIQSFSQPGELKSANLIQFAYPFEIIDNQIVGVGGDSLKNKISQSQFFMLGEEHFSPQISELTNVLLPYFALNGYKNFVLEIGPFTSVILKREMEKHNSLYPFNHSFFRKYKETPIPFFDGTKDEVFLKTALQNNFKLWGIDQEYVAAPVFLIDEIYKNSTDTLFSKKAYLSAKKYIVNELEKLNAKQVNAYFEMFNSDNDFTRYIEQCNEPMQKDIIAAIKLSMDIYESKENFTRMEYMKRNFSENYKIANKEEAFPKVLIKMGGMHLGWGKSWLGIYDLGNMINELACFNNTKAVSVSCFSRYIQQEDTAYDSMNDEEDRKLSLILEMASKDKWVLVDSEKILKFAIKRKVKLNSQLDFLLSKYNFILFAPLKTKVENNY